MPTSVVRDRPSAFQAIFKGQKLFRRSLGTRDHAEALIRAGQIEREFELMVASALGDTRLSRSKITNIVKPRRALDARALADVTQEVRTQIVTRWRSAIVDAHRGGIHSDYLRDRLSV